ncbi:MAG TPA: hypothetical protein VL049_00420 [Candidatus Dormibacteraeota bacterium]|nr:hypothetical protein [Candidatus Dormibacteraeota bacterium]
MSSVAWLVLVPLLASAAAYWPIVRNYFHADDFIHLYMIGDGRLGEFLLTPHGGHLLVVRNAIFVLHHALFGADPRGYLWCALLTHLVNVALLFVVVRAATDSPRLACVGATLWGVSPLHADPLGWYSVYGEVILTTALLVVLRWLLRAQARAASDGRHGALAAGLLLLGALSFGIGIGLAMAMAVAAALLLPGTAHRAARRWFLALALAVPLLYVAARLGYALVASHAYASPATNLGARALLVDVPLMTADMLAYGTAAAATGAFAAPPPARALLVLGFALLAGLAAAAATAPPLARRRIAALLVLAIGGYGIIALGRAPALGAFGMTPAEGAAWARYHYASTSLLTVALALALGGVRVPARLANVATTAILAFTALALWLVPRPIDHYDEERATVARIFELVAARAAAPVNGTAYIHNRALYPLGYVVDRHYFPGWAGVLIALSPNDTADGVPVRFVEADAAVVAEARARPGTRTADLLLTREEYRAAVGQ